MVFYFLTFLRDVMDPLTLIWKQPNYMLMFVQAW